MSNNRTKFMAAVSTDELEEQMNDFLQQENIEVKDVQYQTDGLEKPYSAMILYTDKEEV